jgi:transposase
MANQLKMALQQSIITLAGRGWSFRRIARELGVHRETVARYARLNTEAAEAERAKPAISIIGSDATAPTHSITGAGPPESTISIDSAGSIELVARIDSDARSLPPDAFREGDASKPAISTVGSAGRQSQCEPFRDVIIEMLERGLSAQRIWQDLTAEHGFADSDQSVRRFVRKLRTQSPLPFRRIESEPGAEAQVDFGAAASVITSDGRRRRPHLFCIVLSHSRRAYSEAVFRQTTDDFIRCLENAFHHFGGVPKTLVVDNLKAAVLKADWFDPDLNPKLLAFCEHYGTVILPTKVRTPRHKGKVERGVGYRQDNALKGRTFDSLETQNRHLSAWESSVADTRIHGTIRKQVGQVFQENERSALLPLPIDRFPCFREAQRKVSRDGHVEVAKAYYSAPPEYVTQYVWARWDGRVVRLFNKQLQQIAIHAQREPGRFATDSRHIAAEKRGGIERGATWWLRKAQWIGTDAGRWAESMLQQRGIPGVRVLMGLISLTNKHSDTAIDQACRIAQSHAAYRLRDVRNLLKRQAPEQQQFEFIQSHELIRPLTDYSQWVHNTFQEVHG